MDTPLFESTFRALHPRERRRHRWDGPAQPLPPSPRKRHSIDCPTEEIAVGRHHDSPDGRADDWDVGDPDAADADTWTGVTRDVDRLPVQPAEADDA